MTNPADVHTGTSDAAAARGSTASTVRRVPRCVVVSAWAVPVMVLGQFAFLAVVPVVIVLRRVLRDPRLLVLRGPAGLLGAVYAVPMTLWLLNPDREQSLSKDIHPGFVALIVAASALLLLRIWSTRR